MLKKRILRFFKFYHVQPLSLGIYSFPWTPPTQGDQRNGSWNIFSMLCHLGAMIWQKNSVWWYFAQLVHNDCRELPLAKQFSSSESVKNVVIRSRKAEWAVGQRRSQTSDFHWPWHQNMAHIQPSHIHSPNSHHYHHWHQCYQWHLH